MSVSGSRAVADLNLDEFERRLRAAGSFPMGVEDPLYELARLVESAKPEPSGRAAGQPAAAVAPLLEASALRPALEEEAEPSDAIDGEDAEGEAQAAAYGEPRAGVPIGAERPAKSSAFSWKARISALAIAGVAMIGAVLALKGGVPGMPKQPPYIAAAQGPTKVAPPSGETVSAPNDAGANLLKDNTQSAHVKVVASQEQPVDLSVLTSSSSPQAAANPPLDVSGGPPVKETVDTPVVVAAAHPPPSQSQFPDPKPVRTVSLRPDGTLIPTPAVAAADAGTAAPAVEASKPPTKPASKATAEAPATPQPSTPKIELPTKLSGKSSARVVVAKTDTTAPGSIAEASNGPLQLESPTKPEKAAKGSKPQVAAAEPTVDPASATKSPGWAVQLAAPKSEAEAKNETARLNAKYAAALNGSTIGMHKAVVNGETIYRLRIVGLSKADAAALCARLKGDGGECFIAK